MTKTSLETIPLPGSSALLESKRPQLSEKAWRNIGAEVQESTSYELQSRDSMPVCVTSTWRWAPTQPSARVMESQLDYGNWVRRKNLLILGLCALGAGALGLIPLGFPYRLTILILFVIMLVSFLFPLYAYAMFSQHGGRFQDRLYNLIIQSLGANIKSRVLDIGSGNGVLAVKLAQLHDEVEVVGIDYWGKDWEYSKAVCEQNARAANVERRVDFQKGDAAALEFTSGTFDGAISNLTFHEVQAIADKRDLMSEALRVVKPGGRFAFIDYFYEAKYYGTAADFAGYLSSLNLSPVEYKPLQDLMAIPVLLRHPKILGKVGIIYGRK